MKLGVSKRKRNYMKVRDLSDDYKNMYRTHNLQTALSHVLKDKSDVSLIEIMNDLGGVYARDAF